MTNSALEMRLNYLEMLYRSQELEEIIRVGKRFHKKDNVCCKQIMKSSELNNHDFFLGNFGKSKK
jgi:hypothetical protein